MLYKFLAKKLAIDTVDFIDGVVTRFMGGKIILRLQLVAHESGQMF